MTEDICTALARVIENNPELGHISKQAIEDGIAHLYHLQSELDDCTKRLDFATYPRLRTWDYAL